MGPGGVEWGWGGVGGFVWEEGWGGGVRGCRILECEALPTWVFTCGEVSGSWDLGCYLRSWVQQYCEDNRSARDGIDSVGP